MNLLQMLLSLFKIEVTAIHTSMQNDLLWIKHHTIDTQRENSYKHFNW